MASAIGKRKRRADVSNNSSKNEGDSDDDAAARALFQRAFEKKFKPLEKGEKPAQQKSQISDDDEDDDEDDDDNDSGSESSNSDDEEEDEDFSGFSASEEEQEKESKPQIEVIEDRAIRKTNPAEEKRLKKQFMSSKIPSSTTPQYPIPKKVSATATPAEDDTEDNLQNDLALQRLLKESHLLDPTTFSSSGTASSAPEGAARLRALDMRIRDLGGKKSHMDQERMPIAFRKGMVAKASEKEGKRRTEAKENGIILERFGAKSGGSGSGSRGGGAAGGGKDRKRAIGTGGPDIGTFRGATLRLSKNDIKGIEGSGKRGGKGGRGGRGGKKKGGMNFGSGF